MNDISSRKTQATYRINSLHSELQLHRAATKGFFIALFHMHFGDQAIVIDQQWTRSVYRRPCTHETTAWHCGLSWRWM